MIGNTVIPYGNPILGETDACLSCICQVRTMYLTDVNFSIGDKEYNMVFNPNTDGIKHCILKQNWTVTISTREHLTL